MLADAHSAVDTPMNFAQAAFPLTRADVWCYASLLECDAAAVADELVGIIEKHGPKQLPIILFCHCFFQANY